MNRDEIDMPEYTEYHDLEMVDGEPNCPKTVARNEHRDWIEEGQSRIVGLTILPNAHCGHRLKDPKTGLYGPLKRRENEKRF